MFETIMITFKLTWCW